MSDALEFAKKVLTRFQPPATWNDTKIEAWSQDIMHELSSFSAELLDEMLRQLVRGWTYRGTPEIGDILKFVKPARDAVKLRKESAELKLDPSRAVDEDVPPHERLWTTEGVKLAYDMIQTEMGRRAASEGWIAPLWQFIVVYRRMPTEREINSQFIDANGKRKGLKASAITMADLEEQAKKPGRLAKSIYDAMRFRMSDAQRLADIANGKRVPTRQEYFQQNFGGMFRMGGGAQSSPASAYADENAAEGRGWQGRTA